MALTGSRWIGALVLSLAGSAWSATTLVGRVVRDHPQGGPVAAVEISAPGARSTHSGADGRFTLTFDRAQPGDEVRLMIGGQDWVAVISELLTVALPSTGAAMNVIVSRPAEAPLRRVEFFAQLAAQAVDRSLRTQRDAARGRGALGESRFQLEVGYGRAMRHLPQWSVQAAAARPDQVSSLYTRALRLLADGRSGDALKLLDESRLRQEASAAQGAPDHNVRGWQLRALLLLVTRFEDDEAAIEALRQATRLAPRSFDAWLGLASYRFTPIAATQAAFDRALSIAREGAQPAAVALALHTQGLHSRDARRADEARSQLQESLRIRRELAKSLPELHLPDVAATLADLGRLNLADSRPAEAGVQFAEALQIRRQLARTEPAVHLPDVAACLRAMGLVNHGEGRLAAARTQLEEALQIHRQLAQAYPAAYLPALAATLYNLAALDSDQSRAADAQARRAEAWQIRLTLAGTGAIVHLRMRAGMLHSTVTNGGLDHGPVELRAMYEELLQFFRELAKSDPATYRVRTAWLLDVLGHQSRWDKRAADARAQFEEALQILRALPMPARADYVAEVAQTLGALGSLNFNEGRPAEARGQLTEALRLFRGTPTGQRLYPRAFDLTLTSLADLNLAEGRDAEAAIMYAELLQIHRERAKTAPAALADVAHTLTNLAFLSRNDRKADARQWQAEAVQIYRQLAVTDAATFRPDLARTLYQLGAIDDREGRKAEARTQFSEALQVYRELALADPQHLADLAKTLNSLGALNSFDDRRAEARAQYTEALQIRREVAKARPAAQHEVAVTLVNLARLSSGEKRHAEARAFYGEALGVVRALASREPAEYTIDIARLLRALGVESRKENRLAEARVQFEQALKIYRSLPKPSPRALDEARAVEADLASLAGATK